MSRLVYISTFCRYNKENPTDFGGDEMEYEVRKKLIDIAPLLEYLDQGYTLSADEQAELSSIRKLDAQWWQGELPRSFSRLVMLEVLDLSSAQVSDLTPISKMTGLQSLILRYSRVNDLTPLSGLTGLKFLDICETEVSDLTPLSSMMALSYLDLRYTQVKDISPLTSMTALETLYLGNSQVTDLTPLSGLTTLRALYLNNLQVSELTPLSRLINLGLLDLRYTLVSDLAPLRDLANLRALSVRHTQVCDVTPLSGLSALDQLHLSDTKVRNLTPLSDLEQLSYLDLSYCRLRAIPKDLYQHVGKVVWSKSPEGICLSNTTLSTQPISIFRESNEVIQAYYDAPKKSVRESKVIFLGDGGAGKTHTIKRILKGGRDEDIGTDVTLGISINSYSAEGKNGSFDINFWDFGGQENMHAMHRCFLTERTLYVVVVNNRTEDLDQQARYWLDNIHSFAPDSPVILAVNLWEGIHKFGLDTNRLHRDYPNLVEVQRYSAKGVDDGNFTALTNLIVEQAEKLDSNAMELPENWAAILEQLRELARKEPVPGEKYKGYIDKKKYLEICTDHNLGGDKNQAIRSWLLEWFNDLGICFSYHRDKQTKEELGTYKVLNPKWLTSAIYILLNHADLDVDNGCVTHSEIRKTLKYPLEDGELNRKDQCDYILPNVTYSPQECEYILQVMRKFGLSYQIVGKNKEFIPALCDSQMPKDLHPTGWGTPISYEFRYSFRPDSVIQRMMIRLYGSKTFTKLWRRGFRFDEPDHGLITVVDAGGPNDILRIDVYSNKENKGRDVMMGLITNIAAVNAELNLKPEQYIIVHGNRGEIPAPADMILQAK